MSGFAMRGKALLITAVTTALTVVIGCHHEKHDISYTPKEECVLPPNQARFNQPPSAAFQKRRAKPEDKSLIGRNGSMGSMGSGGPLSPGGF